MDQKPKPIVDKGPLVYTLSDSITFVVFCIFFCLYPISELYHMCFRANVNSLGPGHGKRGNYAKENKIDWIER